MNSISGGGSTTTTTTQLGNIGPEELEVSFMVLFGGYFFKYGKFFVLENGHRVPNSRIEIAFDFRFSTDHWQKTRSDGSSVGVGPKYAKSVSESEGETTLLVSKHFLELIGFL